MMRTSDTIDWNLIRKKIKGTCSASEHKVLECWMKKDASRIRFVERAEKYYQSEDIPIPEDIHTQMAWERFVISRQSVHKPALRNWLPWVAAVLLVMLAGYWLQLNTDRKAADIETTTGPIRSGSKQAQLILSDGSVIDLNKMTRGHKITDKQVNIELDSTGIFYKTGGTAKETGYNTIKIPQGGEYKLVLGDGTQVWLNSKTELTYPVVFAENQRRVKLSGEAYFEVVKNEKSPFIVEADLMVVKVLGTSFNINAYGDESTITTTLISGKVELLRNSGKGCILHPSQQAVLCREDSSIQVKQVNTSIYTQWREGRFIFRNHNLSEIMKILARWYDIEYEFTLPELKQEKFYGVLCRYNNISELLEQFEKTNKVHFEYRNNIIRIKK